MAFMSLHCVGIVNGQRLVSVVKDNHRLPAFIEALPHGVAIGWERVLRSCGTADVSRYRSCGGPSDRNQAIQEEQQEGNQRKQRLFHEKPRLSLRAGRFTQNKLL